MNNNIWKDVKGFDKSELNKKDLKRVDILRRYKPNERSKANYDVDEGIYDAKIISVNLKTNINGNNYIQFKCQNLSNKGPKTLYGSYYLTDDTDESSLTDLRCLLYEYDQDDFRENEIIDDYAIMEHLQVLVGEQVKLVVEDQNGFMSSRLYKEVPVE